MMCIDIREILKNHGKGRFGPEVVGYDTTFCVDIKSRIRDYPFEVGEIN